MNSDATRQAAQATYLLTDASVLCRLILQMRVEKHLVGGSCKGSSWYGLEVHWDLK